MRPITILKWAAVLALAIAPGVGAASAADETLTLTGTMDVLYASGTVGADLAQIAANGNVHTWTLTLHGVTHARDVFTNPKYALVKRSTLVHATSFEFAFAGPDAASLNTTVAAQLVAGSLSNGAFLSVSNAQTVGGGQWGEWAVGLRPAAGTGGIYFTAYASTEQLPFASDADGFPTVPSELVTEGTSIGDHRTAVSGSLDSTGGELVELVGGVGPPLEAALNVSDASVVEGNKGSSKLTFGITLSNQSGQTVSVGWRTVAGTAQVKSDFSAASGTVTFQPGETSKSITVSVKADRTPEPDESLTVELLNAVGAPIADGVGVGTIVNDD